jgi:ribosomal-protein-alanine N-acetyltransferase
MFSIETSRLILRDLLGSDLKPFFQLGSDPAIIRFQHYIRAENENEARSWLQNAVFHNQKVPRKGYNLAVIRKQDMEWVGWIGFGEADNPSIADIEVGYAICKKYWGMDYATEAVRRVTDFCFKELGVKKIFGECDRENPGSARVMEKVGYHWESSYPEIDEATGETNEMLRYSISAQEWEGKFT